MPLSNPNPTLIPGLRSPYDQTGGIVYLGRMFDKIRLHANGLLPADWVNALGFAYPTSFDSRCCRFLSINYDALREQVIKGGTDDEILDWAFANGRHPSEEEIEIWNAFMTKRGWRDSGTAKLHERLAEIGLPPDSVSTMFDFIDLDEGRPLKFG
jgi:gluconokinase